jgi:hypothetical protein
MAGHKEKKSNKNDSNEEAFNEIPEKKESKLLGVINLGTLPLFMIAAIIAVKFILDFDFKTCSNAVCAHVTNYFPQKLDFEDKVKLISVAWVHPSVIVIFVVVLVMLSRVVGNVNPLKSGEPVWITMLNRIIQNTLEQSFVFLGLFSYWILFISTEANKTTAVKYICIFVAGRLVFTVGYMFFWLTGLFGFRACGFLTTLIAQILLISAVFNYDLTDKYSVYLGNYVKF